MGNRGAGGVDCTAETVFERHVYLSSHRRIRRLVSLRIFVLRVSLRVFVCSREWVYTEVVFVGRGWVQKLLLPFLLAVGAGES